MWALCEPTKAVISFHCQISQSPSAAGICLGGEGNPRGCRKEGCLPTAACLLSDTELQVSPAAVTATRTACTVEESWAETAIQKSDAYMGVNKQKCVDLYYLPLIHVLVDAANVTLDFNTAHSKVALSERYTKMSVSDTQLNYNHHPQRFTDCPQVLGFQCFKRGIHYWEVEMQQNNFCGIGICYGSMERQGPDSRLGRNSSSWCIEWFNSKISAWHNDVEKCLPNTKATKIGVLLHCDGGFVLFLTVEEKLNLIYKFKAQFTEAVYPAFWLFSSGTVLSLW